MVLNFWGLIMTKENCLGTLKRKEQKQISLKISTTKIQIKSFMELRQIVE